MCILVTSSKGPISGFLIPNVDGPLEDLPQDGNLTIYSSLFSGRGKDQ
jgi:hypothetical protein